MSASGKLPTLRGDITQDERAVAVRACIEDVGNADLLLHGYDSALVGVCVCAHSSIPIPAYDAEACLDIICAHQNVSLTKARSIFQEDVLPTAPKRTLFVVQPPIRTAFVRVGAAAEGVMFALENAVLQTADSPSERLMAVAQILRSSRVRTDIEGDITLRAQLGLDDDNAIDTTELGVGLNSVLTYVTELSSEEVPDVVLGMLSGILMAVPGTNAREEFEEVVLETPLAQFWSPWELPDGTVELGCWVLCTEQELNSDDEYGSEYTDENCTEVAGIIRDEVAFLWDVELRQFTVVHPVFDEVTTLSWSGAHWVAGACGMLLQFDNLEKATAWFVTTCQALNSPV